MPQFFDKIDYPTRKKIIIFTMMMLSLLAVSFTEGTIIQQFFDLHLPAWPVVAVRNVFAVLGFVVTMGFAKGWF